MKIGIIYAIKKEIYAYLYYFYQLKKIKYNIYGMTIYKSHSKNIFIIKSGIGKVSSSIACTILINIFQVDTILNIGSGGSLKSYISIFDIIVGKQLSYHDINISGFNYQIGEIPNFPKKFKTNNFLRKAIKNILYKHKITFWEGQIISGDQFIHNNIDVKKIKTFFPEAISVDMESTSISQVCFQHNVPVIIIKIISDNTEINAPLIFKKNIKNISLKLHNIISYYIKTIKQL